MSDRQPIAKIEVKQVLRSAVTLHTRLPKGISSTNYPIVHQKTQTTAHSNNKCQRSGERNPLTLLAEKFVELRQETVDFATVVPFSGVPDL